ncbi:MAG: adenosylmethionine--8-amino-7-oxononanoate transaminase [Gemmataceae bacterium]
MKPSRAELEQWDRDHVWHPFTPMQVYGADKPVFIERAHGCFLVDLDGNEYIDGVSSLWCNVHGHRVPALDEAIRAQLDQVAHTTLLGLANVPATLLARRLVELAPPGLTRVFYSDDGATAVEAALKMAIQYWQQCAQPRPRKTKFLALEAAYHGDTLGDVSVGDPDLFNRPFKSLLFPVERVPTHYCYRCPLGLERATCKIDCFDLLEQAIRTHADELAAVVIEPLMQGAAGMIPAPEGYLRRLREVTRACDVLLIADEVAVAFGRTGTMFACTQDEVIPDFLCLAKGLTAGYLPLAATLTTEEVHAAFLGSPEEGKTFYHGHTYTGNPLGAAVALASLELLPGVLASLPAKAARLQEHLERMAHLPIVGDIRRRGLMAGIELVAERASKRRFPPAQRMGVKVCNLARARGVLIRPLGDTLVLMPPLAIDGELLDRLCDVVHESLQSAQEG